MQKYARLDPPRDIPGRSGPGLGRSEAVMGRSGPGQGPVWGGLGRSGAVRAPSADAAKNEQNLEAVFFSIFFRKPILGLPGDPQGPGKFTKTGAKKIAMSC